MSYFDIILLGLIQGLTEFFPVSSSGHLLIGKSMLGVEENYILIDIVLHLGTLFSIIFFWRKDLITDFKNTFNGSSKLYLKLIIACFPVGLVGLLFDQQIENNFFNTGGNIPTFLIINYMLMFIVIYATKFFNNNIKKRISYNHAFIIGFIQCFALMPGISRSGVTIVAALILGYTFLHAMKFSFYLAIPTIFFGSMLKILDVNNSSISIILFVGFICSSIFGYLILLILYKLLQKRIYWYFSVYCLIISIILLVYNYGY